MNKNKYQHILATLFSFFIAFFLFLGLLVGIAKTTVLSQRYLLNSLDECHYYQGIADSLNTDFMQGAGAAGFESKIFENFVTSQDIQSISENYILENFEKDTAEVKTDQFKNKLDTYLHQVAKDVNMKLTGDDEKRLEDYININVEGYKQYLSFPFLQYFVMGFEMMDRVIPFVLVACLIIVIMAFYFLKRLSLNREMKNLYYSTSLIGSGLMIMLPAIFIFSGNYIQRVNLTPKFYYMFFVQYMERYFVILLLCGLLMFLLGILFIFIQKRKRIKSL